MTRTRVLIVDDEPGFTRLLKLGLERVGTYNVREENEGLKALGAARAFRPHIIFMDLIMPRIGGDEVAAEIRADPELNGVPIVFLTAVASESFEVAHDNCTVLPKPVGLDAITTCIEQHCNRSGEIRAEKS